MKLVYMKYIFFALFIYNAFFLIDYIYSIKNYLRLFSSELNDFTYVEKSVIAFNIPL